MTAAKKILCVIPARGGSKRLPNKNLKPLHGLPLIAWSIRAALRSQMCCEVLVSTDSQDIMDCAKSYGALVPWLRPSELASDTANSVDVTLHALNWYESIKGSVDYVVMLQPTSPYRSLTAIHAALELMGDSLEEQSVISVSPAATPPEWMFRICAEARLEPVLGRFEIQSRRSQDIPPAYRLNGSLYMINAALFRQEQRFLLETTRALVFEHDLESIDIDEVFDFEVAEYLFAKYPDRLNELL